MKQFKIYIKDAMYCEYAETMIDAILKFAREYPCNLSDIVGIIEMSEDTKWIKPS